MPGLHKKFLNSIDNARERVIEEIIMNEMMMNADYICSAFVLAVKHPSPLGDVIITKFTEWIEKLDITQEAQLRQTINDISLAYPEG